MVELRQLGRTKLKISAVGMGGIPLQRVNSREATRVVETAIAQGVNFIDTARAYTDSEAKLAEALGNNRGKVIIATKSMARSKEGMAKDIELSLKNMKVDYIDLYQLHNVKDEAALATVLAPDGALAAIKEAREQGKVGFIGITGHIPAILVKALKTLEFDTVQFPFNPVETVGGEELLPFAQELDVGTIAMKPFAGGAIKHKVPALKYILENGFSVAIPGMDDVSQVMENISAADGLPLTDDERALLAGEALTLGGRFCRRCEYCQPCPEGIDIPMIFLLDGYWTRYGLQGWAVDRYKPLKAKASACADCGQCEEKCPYQLPVRQMLREAADHLEY